MNVHACLIIGPDGSTLRILADEQVDVEQVDVLLKGILEMVHDGTYGRHRQTAYNRELAETLVGSDIGELVFK
jgi:hypothetical protein